MPEKLGCRRLVSSYDSTCTLRQPAAKSAAWIVGMSPPQGLRPIDPSRARARMNLKKGHLLLKYDHQSAIDEHHEQNLSASVNWISLSTVLMYDAVFNLYGETADMHTLEVCFYRLPARFPVHRYKQPLTDADVKAASWLHVAVIKAKITVRCCSSEMAPYHAPYYAAPLRVRFQLCVVEFDHTGRLCCTSKWQTVSLQSDVDAVQYHIGAAWNGRCHYVYTSSSEILRSA